MVADVWIGPRPASIAVILLTMSVGLRQPRIRTTRSSSYTHVISNGAALRTIVLKNSIRPRRIAQSTKGHSGSNVNIHRILLY